MSDLEPPSKEDREICWNSRDEYWKCLDSNNDIKEKCLNERSKYEKKCSKIWVRVRLSKPIKRTKFYFISKGQIF